MDTLKKQLENQFGIEQTKIINFPESTFPLMLIELENNSKILTTFTLSEYVMPVPEKYQDRARNELYFLLPSYWDTSNFNDIRYNWVFIWIEKLAKHVVSKETWFGPGHTIPCGNPFKALSESMLQDHLFLVDPIALNQEMAPIIVNNEKIHFLAILPIFGDEMDYKQGKGTFKLLQKLMNHNVTEKLDDFRGSILKRKWRFFGKK